MKTFSDTFKNNSYSSFCRFGAEALAKLLQTIEAQISGVEKSEDIEYVHKMRVTSRRIRATMPLFKDCFPKKRYKRWLNEIKKVTQFLGAARDLDVQIEFIKGYISLLQPTEPKRGMDALLEGLVDQRTNLQSSVINGLQELEKSQVLNEVNRYCEQIIKDSTGTIFNLHSVREKAFWQISSKLDEFLSMEDYVHKENEILKHHEMRIKAKWLRYTMECFAPLYPKEFSGEIEMMKNFQDILGETHDCDVWIDRIPKFIKDLESETVMFPEKPLTAPESNQDLLKFSAFIEEKRKNQYDKFVSSWDTEKGKNAFEELRKTASAGFEAAPYRTQAELANPYVKIAVISDIHANLNALEALLQDAENRGITVFLNVGNMLGFGAFPNEVIKTLYLKNPLSVIGNSDLEILDKKKGGKIFKKFSLEYSKRTLAKSFETYLRSLPIKLELEIAHKRVLVVHDIPGSVDEKSQLNFSEEKLEEFAKGANVDAVIFGNANEQFTRKIGGVLFISPGSAGLSRSGIPQASYAAITANPFSVELLKVSYDVEAAADALRRKGAPESYAQSLLRGVSLEDIIEEDKTKESDMETNCSLVMQSCRRVSEKYWPDIKHAEQVTKLSLELFDAFRNLHVLGDRERCWLECAAILHDAGLSQGPNAHHKNTLKLILNETQLPFTSNERRIIANIARYHRKVCPTSEHYYFMSLSRELRRKVTVLASILRLADSLDFSHQSIVQSVEVQADFEKVTVWGVPLLNPILEEQSFNSKKDLFEKTFAKKIMLELKYQPKTVNILPQLVNVGEIKKTDLTGEEPVSPNSIDHKD